MNKTIFAALCLMIISMIVPQTAGAQNNVIDEVVWVVGDEPILKSDVEQARLEAITYRMKIDGDPYCTIPEQLAVRKLFLHQAAIDSVDVSDTEVMSKVDNQLEEFVSYLGSREKVEEHFGMTWAQKREQLFENFKDEMMISEVRKGLIKDIKVTPAMVRKHFKDVPEDSLPFVPTKVEVQIITREPLITPEEIERVKGLLRDYTERVNSGTSKFSTLALMYSEDGCPDVCSPPSLLTWHSNLLTPRLSPKSWRQSSASILSNLSKNEATVSIAGIFSRNRKPQRRPS